MHNVHAFSFLLKQSMRKHNQKKNMNKSPRKIHSYLGKPIANQVKVDESYTFDLFNSNALVWCRGNDNLCK